MKKLFQKTGSNWVRFSEYEWRATDDGTMFLKPTSTAQPIIYDPLDKYEQLVLDAITIGRMKSQKKSDFKIQKAIKRFAENYGLLGLMTALPTTPNFMDYKAVYLPKNHFIREESMTTEDYLRLFFPFEKPDIEKHGTDSMWSVHNDRAMMALALTMVDQPLAVNMSFQREYSERYEWLREQFVDIAFTFLTSVLYYGNQASLSLEQKKILQQGIEAFGGIAPTYRIALLDKPTIVWDFHSLILVIQIMFSFMLTDDETPIRYCKNCLNPFVPKNSDDICCSLACEEQYKNKKNTDNSKR